LTIPDYNKSVFVLKPKLSHDDAEEMIENKKINNFKFLLQKPKKSDVRVTSFKLYYEAFLLLSGKYTADFIRKANHTINVDSNVREVIIDQNTYPASSKSSVLHKLEPTKKNKIELEVEEHIYLENDDDMAFDYQGKIIDLPYNATKKIIENYTKTELNKSSKIRKPELTIDAMVKKLVEKLKKSVGDDVRSFHEELILEDTLEVYVPIFEAKLLGPKNKEKILRIDAVRKKVL
jgi:hypothetical protein